MRLTCSSRAAISALCSRHISSIVGTETSLFSETVFGSALTTCADEHDCRVCSVRPARCALPRPTVRTRSRDHSPSRLGRKLPSLLNGSRYHGPLFLVAPRRGFMTWSSVRHPSSQRLPPLVCISHIPLSNFFLFVVLHWDALGFPRPACLFLFLFLGPRSSSRPRPRLHIVFFFIGLVYECSWSWAVGKRRLGSSL